ncbi:MAG TPA: cell wall-binding repeat-containing protein, partial [Acidimicrobiales bacterium]|nr:cell wall-binding repeat-containing protein [Acidimicrobiales bacterium]
IDQRVESEIFRVLPIGGTIYVLGGPNALDPSIDTTMTNAGFNVVRYGGATRYDTAVIIADQGLGNPTSIFEATGLDFADALSGGAAAAKAHAAILLTNGTSQAPATAAYLAAHSGDTRTALGGPAAAADPSATPLVGSDRFATSALVATTFFSQPKPTVVGVASGLVFADALSGGAMMGKLGGPMLLVNPSAPLPPSINTFLTNNKSTITQAYIYGGPAALGNDVQTAVQTALT